MAKTAGDYGVEVQHAMRSNSVGAEVTAVVAEMRAQAGPETPVAPPTPVDKGLNAYADILEKCVASNNVAVAGETAKEMIAVEAPTPPPPPV